jgi:hypothetical protein
MEGHARKGACHPVAEARWYMERFAFLELRCMEMLAAWVWNTGNLDYKLVFGAHAYQDMVQADLFRRRCTELHSALPPDEDWQPLPLDLGSLDRICREVACVTSPALKLSGLYGALKPWLIHGYESYLQDADAILEGPTIRLLEQVMLDERRQVAWGQDILATQVMIDPVARDEVERWQAHVTDLLRDASVLAPRGHGEGATMEAREPLVRLEPGDPPSDPRMHLVYYTVGQGPSEEVDFDPQSETEIQQIMLSTLTSVETEATELLCKLLVEFPDLPWEMRLPLCRQMWDETRHAGSQRRLLEQSGAHLGSYPGITYINRLVGDEPDVLKRLIVLQSVVEGISVDQHRPRGRYFQRLGMLQLARMFDYVLADEEIHIGLSRWITMLAGDDEARLHDLAAYQERKEQEFCEFTEWLITKRRDLQRLYQPSGTAVG